MPASAWAMASGWSCGPAQTLWALPERLGHIFYFVVLPMLLLAGVGYVIQRRLGMDLRTLTRLNFFFVLPAVIYVSLVTSPLAGRDVATVVVFSLAMLVGNYLVTLLASAARRVPRDQRHVLLMTTIFHNSGNYGLPLQDMAFRRAGGGLSGEAMLLQAFVMIVQNFATFTLGIFLAANRQQRHWRENLVQVLRFPSIYALAAGVLTVQLRPVVQEHAAGLVDVLQPAWHAICYIKEAYIAVALGTLGAQLAVVRHAGSRYPIKLSVVLRLVAAPAVALGMIYLFGLTGLVAQMLLIGSATPTAVNCLLLCMEFDNHPDFAASSVFYSTLLSPITVTLVIFLAQDGNLPGFALGR